VGTCSGAWKRHKWDTEGDINVAWKGHKWNAQGDSEVTQKGHKEATQRGRKGTPKSATEPPPLPSAPQRPAAPTPHPAAARRYGRCSRPELRQAVPLHILRHHNAVSPRRPGTRLLRKALDRSSGPQAPHKSAVMPTVEIAAQRCMGGARVPPRRGGLPPMHLFARCRSYSHLLIDPGDAEPHHPFLRLPQGFPCRSRAAAESIALLLQHPLSRPPRRLRLVHLAGCAVGHRLRLPRVLRRRQDAAVRLCRCRHQGSARLVAIETQILARCSYHQIRPLPRCRGGFGGGRRFG